MAIPEIATSEFNHLTDLLLNFWGKFIWPVSQDGTAVAISAAQLGYPLEGIDWRNPRWTQRPKSAGQRAVKRLFYWVFMLSAVSGWHVRRCAVTASAGLIPSTAGHIGAACRNVCTFRARPDAQFADAGTQTALVHPDGLSDRPATMKSLVFSVPPRGQVGSASIAQIALVT